jgi:hypothetical protein
MKLLILISAMALGSCAAVPPQQAPGAAKCAITASSDWAAWVNAMPGPNAKPTLIVTGKVTIPTGGYRFEWRDMRAMESYPVQVAVELEAIPPANGATQAVVTQEVRGQWPIDPPVGSLTVRCGGTVLARISPVETAH